MIKRGSGGEHFEDKEWITDASGHFQNGTVQILDCNTRVQISDHLLGNSLNNIETLRRPSRASRPYSGSISVGTWNSQTLFGVDAIRTSRKISKVCSLSALVEILCVQECHGGEHDLRRLSDKLFQTHELRCSPCDSHRSGGLLFIIKKTLISFFEHFNMYEIIPARLA